MEGRDWWAVWFGFIIIIATLIGLVHKVPKIGSWTDDPFKVFEAKRNVAAKLQASDFEDFGDFAARLKGRDSLQLSIYLRKQFTEAEKALIDAHRPGIKPIGGKPIWLYITGQTFNLALTLLAAYLAFGGVLFGKLF